VDGLMAWMTGRRPIPSDARRLIGDSINSVGVLDLLLLVRQQPERWWSPADVTETLHCPVRWATFELEDLRSAGLVEADPDGNRRYRFRPRNNRLVQAVDALAEAYAAHSGEIVRLILAAGWTDRRSRPRSAE
jgi:DNA-binding IclR family transcriptional regulator